MTFVVEIQVYSEYANCHADPSMIEYEEINGVNKPCIRVAGGLWKKLWEDGTDGVYQCVEETAAKVAKVSQVNDPDLQLQCADKLFERMKGSIFGGVQQAALQMGSLDALAASTSSMPPPPLPQVSRAALHDVAQPQVHAGNDATSAQDDSESVSPWASFRLSVPAPKAKVKAQAKKTGGKRAKSGAATDPPPLPEDEPQNTRKRRWVSMEPTTSAAPGQYVPPAELGGLARGKSGDDSTRTEADNQWYDNMMAPVKAALSLDVPWTSDEDTGSVKAVLAEKAKLLSKLLVDVSWLKVSLTVMSGMLFENQTSKAFEFAPLLVGVRGPKDHHCLYHATCIL